MRSAKLSEQPTRLWVRRTTACVMLPRPSSGIKANCRIGFPGCASVASTKLSCKIVPLTDQRMPAAVACGLTCQLCHIGVACFDLSVRSDLVHRITYGSDLMSGDIQLCRLTNAMGFGSTAFNVLGVLGYIGSPQPGMNPTATPPYVKALGLSPKFAGAAFATCPTHAHTASSGIKRDIAGMIQVRLP